MTTVSLHELYSISKEKERKQTQIFDKVLDMSSKKIKYIASFGGYNCFFTIPGVVLGLPLYDHIQCIDYIVDVWRKKGFLVQRLPKPNENTIYISWSPNDVNYKKTIRNY